MIPHAPLQVLLRIGGRMLGGGGDVDASGPGNGAEAPSPQPKGNVDLGSVKVNSNVDVAALLLCGAALRFGSCASAEA